MTLLQRYVLGELVRVFLFTVTVLTCLLVFVGVFAQVQERGLGPVQALQILPYVVPSMLPFTLPSTLLLTVCVVYGRMTGDLEITAAKAAGVSVTTLLWPAFGLGASMCGVSYYAMDQLTPWAMENIERTVAEAMEDIFLDMLETQHSFIDHEHGVSITVLGVQDRKLIMPVFQYSPSGKPPVTIQAQEATLSFNVKEKEVLVHLKRGYVDIPGHDQAFFQEERRAFPLPEESRLVQPRWMTTTRIRQEIKERRSASERATAANSMKIGFALGMGEFHTLNAPEYQGFYIDHLLMLRMESKMRTEIWSRMAMALSCFGFVLVGAPVAIWQGKTQFFSVFFACFLPILLCYYPVVLLSMNLCKTGDANPMWIMWSGNVLLFIAGGVLLRKVLRY